MTGSTSRSKDTTSAARADEPPATSRRTASNRGSIDANSGVTVHGSDKCTMTNGESVEATRRSATPRAAMRALSVQTPGQHYVGKEHGGHQEHEVPAALAEFLRC